MELIFIASALAIGFMVGGLLGRRGKVQAYWQGYAEGKLVTFLDGEDWDAFVEESNAAPNRSS